MLRWLRCFSFGAPDPALDDPQLKTEARVELFRALRTGIGLTAAIELGEAAGLSAAELVEAHQALADAQAEAECSAPHVPPITPPIPPIRGAVNAFVQALEQQQQQAQRERTITRAMAEQVSGSVEENTELIDSSPRFLRSSSQLISEMATHEGSPTSRCASWGSDTLWLALTPDVSLSHSFPLGVILSDTLSGSLSQSQTLCFHGNLSVAEKKLASC